MEEEAGVYPNYTDEILSLGSTPSNGTKEFCSVLILLTTQRSISTQKG